MLKKIKVAEIVLDFSLYPRIDVDEQHVRYIVGALEAKQEMPPVVVDAKSLRCVDGFHRTRAYLRLYGGDHQVSAEAKHYGSDSEMLLDAIRFNASHGRMITSADRAHCIIQCEKLKLEPVMIASALNMTTEKYTELRVGRIGKVGKSGQRLVALKQTIQHMAGRTLTPQQAETNKHLGGMNPGFYANQLIMLIESDLIDTSNEELMERLKKLASLIRGMKAAAA